MKNIVISKGLLLIACLVSLPAMADDDISYRYLEASYQRFDGDFTFIFDISGFGDLIGNGQFTDDDFILLPPDRINIDYEVNAAHFEGVYELGHNIYLLGEYDNNFNSVGQLEVGLGYHFNIRPNVHWLFEAAYNHLFLPTLDIEFRDLDTGVTANLITNVPDQEGFRIGTGVRASLTDFLEIGADASFQHYGGFLSERFLFETNALFKITDWIGINTFFGVDDDGNLNYGGGLRASF